MELKKIGNLESQVSGTPAKLKDPSNGGPSFASTLEKLNSPQNIGSLRDSMAPNMDGVKFSNHAVERMQSRGIQYSPEDLKRLNEAVEKAAAKGSKDTLVLMNESALIVSVKNNTVVTVMDKNALKENVFTNIDSTIVI